MKNSKLEGYLALKTKKIGEYLNSMVKKSYNSLLWGIASNKILSNLALETSAFDKIIVCGVFS